MMHDRYACIDIPLAFQLSHLELPSGDWVREHSADDWPAGFESQPDSLSCGVCQKGSPSVLSFVCTMHIIVHSSVKQGLACLSQQPLRFWPRSSLPICTLVLALLQSLPWSLCYDLVISASMPICWEKREPQACLLSGLLSRIKPFATAKPCLWPALLTTTCFRQWPIHFGIVLMIWCYSQTLTPLCSSTNTYKPWMLCRPSLMIWSISWEPTPTSKDSWATANASCAAPANDWPPLPQLRIFLILLGIKKNDLFRSVDLM